MAKIQFQIGTSDNIQISLPSKKAGDGDTFLGKAKVHVAKLSCSQQILIHKSRLASFFEEAENAYQTLQGGFNLQSDCSTLLLTGQMTGKGHAKITVRLRGYNFKQPQNTEWTAEATFYCYPDELKRVLEASTAG